MADHIADYCRYLTEEKHVQKNTLNSYARDLNQFQAWLLDTGITDLKKVNRDTVSEYLHHMGDQGKSPATITRSAASIRSFYTCQVEPRQGRYHGEGGAQMPGDPDQPRGGAVSGAAEM